jgi:HKD family nuclease
MMKQRFRGKRAILESMKTTRREKSNCKTIENDSNVPAQTWAIDKLNKCEKIKILRFATRTGVTSCGSNG